MLNSHSAEKLSPTQLALSLFAAQPRSNQSSCLTGRGNVLNENKRLSMAVAYPQDETGKLIQTYSRRSQQVKGVWASESRGQFLSSSKEQQLTFLDALRRKPAAVLCPGDIVMRSWIVEKTFPKLTFLTASRIFLLLSGYLRDYRRRMVHWIRHSQTSTDTNACN